MAWKDDFLNGISQGVFSEVVDTSDKPYSLTKKTEELKRNVIPSTYLDTYDFPNLPIDNICDVKNESAYLLKIKQGIDMLSQLPIGQNILSYVWSKTYFSALPLNKLLGTFCVADVPYVFLKASDDVFGCSNDTLKILTHELTHAKNEEVQSVSGFYVLPPKLYFMCRIFNELSARFNEKIVLSQISDQYSDCNIISSDDVFETLHAISQKSYLTDFADKIVKKCHDVNQIVSQPALTEENLKMASYYMKSYPALKSLALIGEMERLYENHIYPCACQKWPELKCTLQSKESMER